MKNIFLKKLNCALFVWIQEKQVENKKVYVEFLLLFNQKK